MPVFTLCIHGNAFCSEQYFSVVGYDFEGFPITGSPVIDSGTPRGWGRTFTVSGWYHAAMPNIISTDGAPMYIEEILVLMNSFNMNFDLVHLWEGGSFLWSGSPVVSSARNLLFRPRDAEGRRLYARSGLGVSLFFTNTGGGFVTFNSASVTLQSTR